MFGKSDTTSSMTNPIALTAGGIVLVALLILLFLNRNLRTITGSVGAAVSV
jgi:hypothetical protein